MTHKMKPYYDLIRNILDNGHDHPDRTGVGRRTVAVPNQLRFDMRPIVDKDGSIKYPLCLDPGRLFPFKSAILEILWMLTGNNNVEDLRDMGTKGFWEKWAFLPSSEQLKWFAENSQSHVELSNYIGTIGPMYGQVWRGKTAYSRTDQLVNLIDEIMANPFSSRLRMVSWIPDLIPTGNLKPWQNVASGKAALAPCHGDVMVIMLPPEQELGKNRMVLRMAQRSADVMVGLPHNIAQYSFLIHFLAEMTNSVAHELVVVLDDAHIYQNHVGDASAQLSYFSEEFEDTDTMCELVCKKDTSLIPIGFHLPHLVVHGATRYHAATFDTPIDTQTALDRVALPHVIRNMGSMLTNQDGPSDYTVVGYDTVNALKLTYPVAV